MRNFLPIKGPGGRNLTGKEKIALLVLVVTLLLCVLTLVAGEKAYLLDDAPNPIFSVVSAFGSALGGGIVALYALIMVWSALIYLKGERVADITPIVGRCAAAFAVTVGISGALGIAHLEAAGGLGDLVGRSLGNTFGAGAGFPILILLMLLGAHLASQGAWTALREPMMPAIATPGGTLAPVGYGFGLAEAPESRLQDGPPMPDDGDPTADERSLAVQQAVAEIERSQGVTIVDVEAADTADDDAEEAEAGGDETRSIGEEVDEAPAPEDDTEEAEVQRGLAAVAHALEVTRSADEDATEDAEADVDADEEADEAEVETGEEPRYHTERHGLVPVPVGEGEAETAEEEEAVEEDEDEFAEVEQYDDEDEDVYETAEDDVEEEEENEADYEDEDVHEGEYAEDDEELEEEEDGEYAEHDEEEADEEAEGEYAEHEDEDEEYEDEEVAEYEEAESEEEDEEDDDEPAQLELFEEERAADEPVQEALPPEPEPEPEQEQEQIETGTETEQPDTDPYAQGGLLRRLQARGPKSQSDGERPHTAFDWRGRPIK